MKITFELSNDEVQKLFGGVEETKDKRKRGRYPYGPNNVKVWFNEECPAWEKYPEHNKMYLQHQQTYFNDLLRTRGHLYLNEIFDSLGIPRTKFGQVAGWVYEDENSYVDFGLLSESNKDFVNGKTLDCLLVFNVDGIIIDRI